MQRIFAALDRGFSLATALHAPGVEESFEVICGHNGVPDEQAGHLDLLVYIEVFRVQGGSIARRVTRVYEIDGVEAGVPAARLLHRHHVEDDSFEVVEAPQLLDAGLAQDALLARFRAAVEA